MPTNRSVLVFAVLTLLMGALALYFGFQFGQTKAALAITRQQVLERDRMLFRQERAYQHELTTADADAAFASDTVKVEPPAAAVFADELGSLNGEQLSNLMKAGLPADPEVFLRQDAIKHSAALLPAGADAGGTGQITDVRILTAHYALAAFRDGSTTGTALLRYDVTGPGRVTWRALDRQGDQ